MYFSRARLTIIRTVPRLSAFLDKIPLSDPYCPRLSYQESDYIICTAHLAEAPLHHGVVILNDEIQRLG